MNLTFIEAINILLCAGIGVYLNAVYDDPKMLVGLVMGTLVSAANFRLLKMTVTRAVERTVGNDGESGQQDGDSEVKPRKGGLTFMYIFKIIVFFGLIWLILMSGWVNIITFIIGLSLIVVAIILEGARFSLVGGSKN